MKNDLKYEYDKDKAFIEFIKNNPHHPITQEQKNKLDRLKLKEKRRKAFIKEYEKILTLQHKNKLTLKEIGKKFGVSYQAIEQKIYKGRKLSE